MTRTELTWLLRIGPWWVGLILFFPFCLICVPVVLFFDCCNAVGQAIDRYATEMREGFNVILNDRHKK